MLTLLNSTRVWLCFFCIYCNWGIHNFPKFS